ncbi:MAG: hypothetical protein ACHQ53_06250 [Polyangiales bacterium]
MSAKGDSGTAQAATPKDPATAMQVSVDRFSKSAAMLMLRTAVNGLPAANQPVDFDQAPFITQGFGPKGGVVRYYNFDVQSRTPAPIYVLFAKGKSDPVDRQLNIIDVLPGEPGYNDFWQVNKVTVPDGYVANTITSFAEIEASKLTIEPTTMLVNCPVVPDGSTAKLRIGGGSAGLQSGWYKGKLVKYFSFEEKALSGEMVPVSPIFVTFNVNPDKPNGGPASGFVTESDGVQTHNVVATLPSDAAYSPLWSVQAYDNADFDGVSDLSSVSSAHILGMDVATVNCPIVDVQ